MILKAYSIYDAVASAFNTPFFSHNNGMAMRSFQQAINDENTQLSKNPADYALFHIGEFDDKSGNFIALDIPSKVCIGIEMLDADRPKYTDRNMDTLQESIKRLQDTVEKVSLKVNNAVAKIEENHIEIRGLE